MSASPAGGLPRANAASPARVGASETTSDVADLRVLSMRALIASDLQVWAETMLSRPRGRAVRLPAALHMLMSSPGVRAVVVYRLAHAAQKAGIRLLPILLTNLNLALHGFDIPPSVPVGRRFYVPHPVGTVVMARGLGDNVTLVSAVTVGMRSEHQQPRFPLLGNDVYVGAGARVLGGISLGDRVQVGANAVVIHDVPNDSVAVGIPATVRPARPANTARADSTTAKADS